MLKIFAQPTDVGLTLLTHTLGLSVNLGLSSVDFVKKNSVLHPPSTSQTAPVVEEEPQEDTMLSVMNSRTLPTGQEKQQSETEPTGQSGSHTSNLILQSVSGKATRICVLMFELCQPT